MRIRYVVLAAMLVGSVLAAVAYAKTTYDITTEASINKKGSKTKPARFNGTIVFKSRGENGERGAPSRSWDFGWNKVKVNGEYFPKCSAEEIDQAQSNSVCPKGSLVAEGPFVAHLGPTSDKRSSFRCEGKTALFYNGGKDKMVEYVTGPGDRCAGVGYIPPTVFNLRTARGATRFHVDYPENQRRPLPGVEAGLSEITIAFKPLKVRKGGKTRFYLSSTGCKNRRTLSFTVKDEDDQTVTVTDDAGKCTR